MEDLAILASILMAGVILSGAFALATAWFDGPLWIVIPASLAAMGMGAWWFTVPTAMAMLGPISFLMGLWALIFTVAKTWSVEHDN